MAITSADGLHPEFAAAYNAGDIERLMNLYTPNAQLVPSPGMRVSGHEAIRQALAGFLALKGKMVMTPRLRLEAEGTALLISDWTIDGIAPDGSSLSLAGQTSDVAVRQADGGWLVAIDNPFGGEGAGPA